MFAGPCFTLGGPSDLFIPLVVDRVAPAFIGVRAAGVVSTCKPMRDEPVQ